MCSLGCKLLYVPVPGYFLASNFLVINYVTLFAPFLFITHLFRFFLFLFVYFWFRWHLYTCMVSGYHSDQNEKHGILTVLSAMHRFLEVCPGY